MGYGWRFLSQIYAGPVNKCMIFSTEMANKKNEPGKNYNMVDIFPANIYFCRIFSGHLQYKPGAGSGRGRG